MKKALLKIEPDLPDVYIKFMENYPELLSNTGDASSVEILNKTDDLIDINNHIKQIHEIDHASYFAIGHSGCGDYYLIDINDDDPEVILWDHDMGSLSENERYNSIEEFAGYILQSKKELKALRAPRKRWWNIF